MSVHQSTATEARKAKSLRDTAGEAFDTSRRQLAGLLELATLEARYSALMLAAALALAVILAIALLCGWGLLVAAAVAQLTLIGWSWAAALASMGAFHAVLAFAALLLLRRCIARIGLDATRRILSLGVQDVSE